MSASRRTCAVALVAIAGTFCTLANSAQAAIYSGLMSANLKIAGFPGPTGGPGLPSITDLMIGGSAIFDPGASATGAATAGVSGDAMVLGVDPLDMMIGDSLDYMGSIGGTATAPPDSASFAFAVGFTDMTFTNLGISPIAFTVELLLTYDFDISASVAGPGEDASISAFLFVALFPPAADDVTLFALDASADALLGPPAASGAAALSLFVPIVLGPGESAAILMDAGLDGFAVAESQNVIPEPTALLTWSLLALGGVGVAFMRRRKR